MQIMRNCVLEENAKFKICNYSLQELYKIINYNSNLKLPIIFSLKYKY